MDMSRRRFLRFLAAAAACGCAPLGACASVGDSRERQGAPQLQRSFFCFDTICVIGGALAEDQLDAAVERCSFFEDILSATIDTSDVSRLNGAGGAAVTVQPETADLIGRSLAYCRESEGLFDITIGAVSSLWDFKQGIVPDERGIERALPHVNYANVQVDGNAVHLLDPDARIDLGGIAKGYIADDILAGLQAQGVQSAFVNFGGNVKVLGTKQDGSPWTIGVRSPQQGSDTVVATRRCDGGSLVTSGLYERSFERGGRRYWHILDPRTGYPVESDLVSASIFSQTSLDGDGYTKPLFMLGKDGALAFLARHAGLEGLLIDAEGGFAQTEGEPFTLV